MEALAENREGCAADLAEVVARGDKAFRHARATAVDGAIRVSAGFPLWLSAFLLGCQRFRSDVSGFAGNAGLVMGILGWNGTPKR